MNEADAVAAVLLVGAMMYAIFGGADFGAGLWELVPARGKLGEKVNARIDHSLTPVWEANHVWLIFILVVAWTGFPEAFSAVMSTLYIPLALAALGIVLRGANFAFRHVFHGSTLEWATRVFAVSSILTPFFMGTVVGAIAAGEVPADGNGDPTGSWIGPLPLLIGAMSVAVGAYIAAVFLVHDSRAAGENDVEAHFRRCALGAALSAGSAGGRRGVRAPGGRPLRLRRPNRTRAAAGDRFRPGGAGGAGPAGARRGRPAGVAGAAAPGSRGGGDGGVGLGRGAAPLPAAA